MNRAQQYQMTGPMQYMQGPMQGYQPNVVMQRPVPIPGCPSGLEYLTQIDRILVQQQIDILEAFTGWNENNRYVVRNGAGQQIYYAFENSEFCMRMCCESGRGFTINIVDNSNQLCLKISREFKCCAGCCWCAGCCDCCAHVVKIESSNGQVLGYVKQKGSCLLPLFHVLDAQLNPVFQIKGTCCRVCPTESQFDIVSIDGSSNQGRILKQFGGFVQEMLTNADNFMVEFPLSLPIDQKATLFGALFLIDFMFFEGNNRNNNNHNH